MSYPDICQLCLCILIMTSGTSMSLTNNIILGFGVAWACLTAMVGGIAVSDCTLYSLTSLFSICQLPLCLNCRCRCMIYKLSAMRKWSKDEVQHVLLNWFVGRTGWSIYSVSGFKRSQVIGLCLLTIEFT